MKRLYFVILAALLTFQIVVPVESSALEQEARVKLISQIVYQGLQVWHYSGKKIDDQFSLDGFKEYLKYIDFNKRFLLKSDVEEFGKFSDQIDDEFHLGTTRLMELAKKRMDQRIRQVMEFYPEILASPFDFSSEESLELDGEKRDYASNLDGLREHWRKILKQQTLIRTINMEKTTGKDKPFAEIEKKARLAVGKSYRDFFNRLLQSNENDAFSLYFNSILRVFDPHTSYFAPKQKQDFDLDMTGTFEGIGALLADEEGGFIKIESIVPGGPSWRQKQLQPGDIILKVGEADKEPLDLVGIRAIDAVKFIRGKKGTTANLTVKKPDGRIVVIPIVRDTVVVEETFARSAIFSDKNNESYGYIFLPRFYNDSLQANGRVSTEDVKRQLAILQKNKVKGVILDLRNNSGGTLMDAVNLSGLFISDGPIVQIKGRGEDNQVLEDRDKQISYNGPLVVLMNALSASASEILAAALQDYNRAVIVGGNHTFGKGTVQAMIDLDRFISNRSKSDDTGSLGALKMTIQKFYRVTGAATQFTGVTPDVVLPDRYDYLELGEKYLDYSLNWDSITPVGFTPWKGEPLPVDRLQQLSKERVNSSNRFQVLSKYIERLKTMRDQTEQDLRIDIARARQQRIQGEAKSMDVLAEKFDNFKLSAPRFQPEPEDKRLSREARKITEDWLAELMKDLSLNEAIQVLRDLASMRAEGSPDEK